MSTPWTFPVVDLSADSRRQLPVFQINPNWADGVTETLTWLTEVMSSEQAVEQRRSLRRYPRRTFEYGFMRQCANRNRLENFIAGVGKRDHLVPLWHEQFSLPSATNTAGTIQFPAGELVMREFAVGDLVMVTTLDADRYAVLTVTAQNDSVDTIQLRAAANVGTWPAGSRLVPLRRAKVLDAATVENVTDRVGTSRIRFQLQDADTRFDPSWGYCSPLWRTRPDRSTPLSMNFDRSDYLHDFSTGVVTVTDPGDRAQISQSMALVFFSRADTWAYRSFLYNARGRARRFYVPTFMNDIEPLADLGGLQFSAKPNGFSDYFEAPQEARRILGIDFKDGRPSIYRTINGIAPLAGTLPPFNPVAEVFLLSEPLPPIASKDIERINFVAPSRFDQDTFEIFHVVAGSTACKSAVVTRSSVVEGMPPIECWVTSRPYPVDATDGFKGSATILGGGFYDPRVFEYMTGASRVTGGGIETFVFSAYDNYAPEAITGSAVLTGGGIETFVFSVYDRYAPEAITAATRVSSGALDVLLINYQILHEGIAPGALVTGGTLL